MSEVDIWHQYLERLDDSWFPHIFGMTRAELTAILVARNIRVASASRATRTADISFDDATFLSDLGIDPENSK